LQNIGSGGTAVGTTIFKGGEEQIFSGGTAVNTTVSGGAQVFNSGGSAINTVVNAGGVVNVLGSILTSATIKSGGTLGVGGLVGGVATSAIVLRGGFELMYLSGSGGGVVSSGGTFEWQGAGQDTTGVVFRPGAILLVELHVAPGELGRVIGKHGRTAAALRTLAATAGEKEGKTVTLEIRDAKS